MHSAPFGATLEIQEASLIGPVRALVKLRSWHQSVLARFMASARDADIFVVFAEIIKKYRILWEFLFPMSLYWHSKGETKVIELFAYYMNEENIIMV